MSLFHKIQANIQLPSATHEIDPKTYLLHPDLTAAINVALASGQPLLLTGEPGTGKTQLAYKIAHELHQQDPSFLDEPLVFHTKTSSVAKELFYSYDALGHFQDANLNKKQIEGASDPSSHIHLQAMGKAIAMSNPSAVAQTPFSQGHQARNSVVLIDEIDKAPRDFPNDILHEIDQQEFMINEANRFRIAKGPLGKIMVVMTSNSEKNLPDAFLRRCIFYHIAFPDKDMLLQIVSLKLGTEFRYGHEELVDHFLDIRREIKKKKPATAELITWLRVLELGQFLDEGVNLHALSDRQRELLRMSYSVIAKNKEDLQQIKQRFLSSI